MNGAKTVAVLMGGASCEREVSLVSGDAVSKALGEAALRYPTFTATS